jgi:hypothetical protein
MGTVRILYTAGTISHQASVHPKYRLGALNMKEEEEGSCCKFIKRSCKRSPYTSELTKVIGTTPQSIGRSK